MPGTSETERWEAAPSAAHTYNQAGTFTATLTVTDNVGAQASATVNIIVTDPNILNAPSGLTASASGKVVTLRWTDNASNETGFYVERGIKSGKTLTYTRVATVAAGVDELHSNRCGRFLLLPRAGFQQHHGKGIRLLQCGDGNVKPLVRLDSYPEEGADAVGAFFFGATTGPALKSCLVQDFA